MIEMGKHSKNYFHRCSDQHGQKQYRLKSIEEYKLEQSKDEQPSKCYFPGTTLSEIINSYPMSRRSSFTGKEMARGEKNAHLQLVLQGQSNHDSKMCLL